MTHPVHSRRPSCHESRFLQPYPQHRVNVALPLPLRKLTIDRVQISRKACFPAGASSIMEPRVCPVWEPGYQASPGQDIHAGIERMIIVNKDASRPLTAEDLCRFTPLGEPQISPDGETIAFIRQYRDLQDNATRTEIWMVSVGDETPRRLTSGGRTDHMPRWSPDGSRLAFISDRTGRNQLYLIDLSGGEAERVATEKEPLSALIWSPDGERIAFVAYERMLPQGPFYPGAPEACRLPHDVEDEQDEPRVIKTLRHRQDGIGYFGNQFRHIFVVDAQPTGHGETSGTHRITRGRYNHESPAWSPDGQYIACVANRTLSDSDPVWVRHLWVFEVASGRATRVLQEDYPVNCPSWSPDGSVLAFIGADYPFDWVSSPYNLFTVDFDPAVLPRSWDSARNLTGSLDRRVGMVASSEVRAPSSISIGPILWADDGGAMYTTVAREGGSYLYRIASDGEEPPRCVTPGRERVVAAASLSRDGTLAYLDGGPTQPDEVFVMSPDGCEGRLTDLNGPLARDLQLVEPERLRFEGTDGWEIEGWLMKPPGWAEGERCPTILAIHGGPSGMYGYGFSLQFQQLAGEGFAVLYLNPRGSSGYGAEFSLAVVKDWGGKDYQDLMAGVDHGIELGVVDPNRLGVTGWSYGGFMTCWTVTQTDRFSAAVSGACVTNQLSRYGTSDVGFDFTEFSAGARPWEDPDRLLAHSSIRYMGQVSTPLLMLHGEEDRRCPVTQSEEAFAALRRQDKECVLVRYPGESHGLARPRNLVDRAERISAWFRHYLT